MFVDIVDVGGGFPSVYPGMVPPDMSEYVDAIHRGFDEMPVHETTELWCEPGRALVAEASSILTKVELQKGDALYLNDGSYGSLFDAAHSQVALPGEAGRGDGERRRGRAEALPLLRPDLRLPSTTCRARSGCRTTCAKATTSRSACWAPMAWP